MKEVIIKTVIKMKVRKVVVPKKTVQEVVASANYSFVSPTIESETGFMITPPGILVMGVYPSQQALSTKAVRELIPTMSTTVDGLVFVGSAAASVEEMVAHRAQFPDEREESILLALGEDHDGTFGCELVGDEERPSLVFTSTEVEEWSAGTSFLIIFKLQE